MAELDFDESLVAQLEQVYSTRDVIRRRRLAREALGARPGERILDVGCGPGFYAAELADEVGTDGRVVGLDQSPAMLAVAEKRTEDSPNVEVREGEATSLPVDDGSFDRTLWVQVLEYVPDVPAALAETHRVLRPGGRALVWDVDWATLSMHTEDRARMERVLTAWDKHLVHPSLPRRLSAELRTAGFDDIRMEGHVFATNELVDDAYCGSFVPLISEFVAAEGSLGEDEAQAWEAELRELNERGEFYAAVVQFCFTATKPA
jgi:arsenite methyltransferase